MAIRPFKEQSPVIDSSAYVDPSAVIIGDVDIGGECSIWPMAALRGDVNYIRIGRRTNIQDGSVLHVTHDHPGAPGGHPVIIGDAVTVGHNVTLHGCTVGDRCLVGMGSTLLDGVELESEVLLGAGSLVPPGKRLQGGYLYVGSPVQRIRPLSAEERAAIQESADQYFQLAEAYRNG